MIRYLYADQLPQHPKLARSMFRDRAAQFSTRLGWDVSVDARGFELDQYDRENPAYVIWQEGEGSHGGSLRLLPTTGPTMVNDHFTDLSGGGTIQSPLIWEATRFCLSPKAKCPARVSAALMLGAAEMGRAFGLNHAVGVFDAPMLRVYRALGWPPTVLGRRDQPEGAILVGLWDFKAAPMDRLSARAEVTRTQSREWFDLGFRIAPPPVQAGQSAGQGLWSGTDKTGAECNSPKIRPKPMTASPRPC